MDQFNGTASLYLDAFKCCDAVLLHQAFMVALLQPPHEYKVGKAVLHYLLCFPQIQKSSHLCLLHPFQPVKSAAALNVCLHCCSESLACI